MHKNKLTLARELSLVVAIFPSCAPVDSGSSSSLQDTTTGSYAETEMNQASNCFGPQIARVMYPLIIGTRMPANFPMPTKCFIET
jgi:hypothetical protein